MTQRITIDIGGERVSVPVPPSSLVAKLRDAMSDEDKAIFRDLRDGKRTFHPATGFAEVEPTHPRYGQNNLISAHILGGGMAIRNWMRGQEESKDWDCHDLDNVWITIVEAAIRE